MSLACGVGAYMDLLYAGQTPGSYHELTSINSTLHGWQNGSFRSLTTPIGDYTAEKGGRRGRYWAEWASLWTVIADWVYENDVEALQLGFISNYSHKYRVSDEEDRSIDSFGKIPREVFETEAVGAADAIRDIFAQLAAESVRFQGIEWDYFELDMPETVREAFYARFGKGADCGASRRYAELLRMVGAGNMLVYDGVSPEGLKRCPSTVQGAEWETWLSKMQRGDVVLVETIFQALWAAFSLCKLSLHLNCE
jgi:hypothetical protein